MVFPFHYPPYRLPLSLCIIRIIRSLSFCSLLSCWWSLFGFSFSLLLLPLSSLLLFLFFAFHLPLSSQSRYSGLAFRFLHRNPVLYSLFFFFCLTTATYSHPSPRLRAYNFPLYPPVLSHTHSLTVARTYHPSFLLTSRWSVSEVSQALQSFMLRLIRQLRRPCFQHDHRVWPFSLFCTTAENLSC